MQEGPSPFTINSRRKPQQQHQEARTAIYASPPSVVVDPKLWDSGDTRDDLGACGANNRFRLLLDPLAACIAQRPTTPEEVIYVIACYGGWSVVFFLIYPLIDASDTVASYHKTIGWAVFAACLGSWRLARSSGPGNITAQSMHEYDNYRYDNILYRNNNNVCPTLQIRKLARSKYNRYTATHVPRFDHHCHVLNQAVGECNYRYFCVFLWVHGGMCWYGSVTVFRLVWGQVVHSQESPRTLVARPLTAATVLPRLVAIFMENPLLTLFGFTLAAAGLLVSQFGGFHLYLVCTGKTTNEYYKWKDIAAAAAIYSKIQQQQQQQRADDEENGSSSIGGGDGAVVHGGGGGRSRIQRPVNLYNLGIVGNVREVFFPRCLQGQKKTN